MNLYNHQPTYEQVKCRYESLRQLVRKITHDDLPSVLSGKKGTAVCKDNVFLKAITPECLHKFKVWEASGKRKVVWDWNDVRKMYKPKPKRFELAIWHGREQLAGAAIGKPTCSGGKLRLDFIESSPLGTPLDGLITDLVIKAGITYAEAIGAVQLRIMKPVNERVRKHYLSKTGFKFNSLNNFCYRDL